MSSVSSPSPVSTMHNATTSAAFQQLWTKQKKEENDRKMVTTSSEDQAAKVKQQEAEDEEEQPQKKRRKLDDGKSAPAPPARKEKGNSSRRQPSPPEGEMHCFCKGGTQEASFKTAMKAGPNQGRDFWGCPNFRADGQSQAQSNGDGSAMMETGQETEKCRYFLWADADDAVKCDCPVGRWISGWTIKSVASGNAGKKFWKCDLCNFKQVL